MQRINSNQLLPEAVLELEIDTIGDMFLSLANRNLRNRQELYLQRHENGVQKTYERDKKLSDLNITIPEHFYTNLAIHNITEIKDRYIAVGAGDCTANLFRPSYDASQNKPLFYLSHEPIGQKVYYAFIVKNKDQKLAVQIEKIWFNNETPTLQGKPITSLKWLFCSVPLVLQSKIVDNITLAVNDYDLRHTFGEGQRGVTRGIYAQFKQGYDQYEWAIKQQMPKMSTADQSVQWYHAGIGIREDKIIIVHHRGSLSDLAKVFHDMKVDNALLLDSGGSSVIWNNWSEAGAIAHNSNYRPKRGAIIIFKLV